MDYSNYIGRFITAGILAIGSYEIGRLIGYYRGVQDGLHAERKNDITRTIFNSIQKKEGDK